MKVGKAVCLGGAGVFACAFLHAQTTAEIVRDSEGHVMSARNSVVEIP